MCGIAGIALKPGYTISSAQKDLLLQALNHRGPDGSSQWEGKHAVLLHTRLSIIDVEGGRQPFIFQDRMAAVVNGEIYNDLTLREELTTYPFQTGSDCEGVLPLWQQFQMRYPEKLRGMYGVALVDLGQKTVALSRDPFGIKPLYYACVEQGVVFASEPQAIIHAGFVTPQIYNPALGALLQLQFIPGQQTVFQGIERLLPGETLLIQGGKIIDRRGIKPFKTSLHKIKDASVALQKLDQVLEESVRIHERSDVPFGLFLSSGIDSTIILKMMHRLGQQNRIHAWTARFDIDGFAGYVADETEQAAFIANKLGAEHHIFSISSRDVWTYLPQIVACMDDPVADYAIIPTWFLAKEASKSVKVILSGEGGDELFAGYGRYRKASKPWWQGGRGMYRKGAFYKTEYLSTFLPLWRQGITQVETSLGLSKETLLARAQRIDIETWLPNDLLIKLDRCLMAHGIEGRVPFLDKEMAQFAADLADDLKVHQGQGKWILRKWLEVHLPQSNPFADKKGFSVPIGLWIEQQARVLAPLVAAQAGVQEVAFPDKILSLFEKASGRKERYMAWNLLFYALWHQIHIVGKSSQGTVVEVLAA